MKKKILLFLFLCGLILVVANYRLVNYGYMQAKGQLTVLWEAKPIGEILSDTLTTDAVKAKIRLMQEIKGYAIDSLGLSSSNNYTTLFDQKGKDILWNLSASEAYKLSSREWSFPIIGTFSYKGFFDLEKAKNEEMGLVNEGYDTRIRPVSAWSTLGWFDDPILSKTLMRSEGSLADLVIHELTHSTIFVTDSLTFNENLASFIGEQGAKLFLQSKYGLTSPELIAYLDAESDFRKYTEHMLRGARYLDSTYLAIENVAYAQKEQYKQEAILKIVEQIDTLSFMNTSRFKGVFSKKMPNNAYFLAYHRYTSKLGIFEEELFDRFEGDLVEFINFYRNVYGK